MKEVEVLKELYGVAAMAIICSLHTMIHCD